MHVPSINYIAVLLAAVSSLVVASFRYNPWIFGHLRTTPAEAGSAANTSSLGRAVLTTLISGFVTAWILAGAAYLSLEFYGGGLLVNSLLTGLILWLGFTAARIVGFDQFARRRAGLTLFNLAHELVTIEIMALIIGVWPA